MKKRIPVIIAVVLILLTVGACAVIKVLEKYAYSDQRADLNEYYGVTSDGEAAVMLQNELLDIKAQVKDGRCYLDLDTVHAYLNDRFYEDAEGILIYALPNDLVMTRIGSTQISMGYYTTEDAASDAGYILSYYDGDGEERTVYVALDFVKQYTNFGYTLFTEPNRIQLDTVWEEEQVAELKKDTQVRYQGGVKSDILTDVKKGDNVVVLETMENWSKVKTADSVIGYVENRKLTAAHSETPEAVMEYLEPEYTSQTRDYKINLAWHQVTNQTANSTFPGVLSAAKGVNVISPTWYSLSDNQGNFMNIASTDYVNTAHGMGLEVWGLVDNFNKDVDTGTVLGSLSTRTALVTGLVQEARARGLDGINIDFENISESAGESFVQFLRELSILCRSNGIVLSVDNYVPKEYSAHYNRAEQGVVADYVIIMGYDEHWGGGGVAGSVASIDFVEEGIVNTLADVPKEKVINALPFYTRIWKTVNGEVTSEAVGMDTAQAFLDKNGVTAVWDEGTCQNYAEFTAEDGSFYQVWLEDEQSLAVKLNVMKMNELAGVAAWKLGFERASVWDVIAEAGYTK
ncbi:MAG: SH3 domain-containing protein [Clostridiales bacterium]|nr:SH3 domain-containing protein [Clostridiales bacterium]